MSYDSEIGIIGGGVSGLSTAYLLNKKGFSVTIYEAQPKPGGALKSHRQEGWIAEFGPNTIMARNNKILDLINDIGLGDDLVFANNHASKRFIVRNGTPVTMPTSLYDFITTELFSTSAKFRLLKEPFIQKWDQTHEENLAEFVKRRLGEEFLDYAINPFVAGVYAGDPEHLSVKHAFEKLYDLEQDYGSLIWGQIRGSKERKNREGTPKTESKLFSFKHGIQQLPEALADNLSHNLLCNSTVKKIQHDKGDWSVTFEKGASTHTNSHKGIIYTAPLHKISTIEFDCKTDISRNNFEEVTYPPIAVIGLGFNKVHIAHKLDGFGMLVPRKEDYKILGTLFNSTLFPNRAPEEHVLLTTFAGGMRNPGVAELSKEELRELVIADLDELLGVIGGPVFEFYKYWPKSIPQYDVGYGEILNTFKEIEKDCPGFIFSGNYRYGISVSDCLSSAYKVSERVEELLKAR